MLAAHLLSRQLTARVPTHEDDTHEDFKPKFNPDAEPRTASTVQDQIKRDITEHSVFVYMKVPSLCVCCALVYVNLPFVDRMRSALICLCCVRASQRRPSAALAT